MMTTFEVTDNVTTCRVEAHTERAAAILYAQQTLTPEDFEDDATGFILIKAGEHFYGIGIDFDVVEYGSEMQFSD